MQAPSGVWSYFLLSFDFFEPGAVTAFVRLVCCFLLLVTITAPSGVALPVGLLLDLLVALAFADAGFVVADGPKVVGSAVAGIAVGGIDIVGF